jgi:hypothetical protein
MIPAAHAVDRRKSFLLIYKNLRQKQGFFFDHSSLFILLEVVAPA